MTKPVTYVPLLMDKDTVRKLVTFLHTEAKAYLDADDETMVDFELFCRVFARTFIHVAGEVGDEECGVEADVKKVVAYGFTAGCLDMMYRLDPNVMQKVYADRKSAGLN